MDMQTFIIAIDQGTTSSRAAILNCNGTVIAQHQVELTQHFPHESWVEHDPEEIWQSVLQCCKVSLQQANLSAAQIAALGISNQRETTIIWDRHTGKTIYPAIVWQDRRTAEQCAQATEKIKAIITNKTGLIIDPYFSATKIAWILDQVPNARVLAERGDLAFGTIDTFLVWRLTQGRRHATDATNASRTLLFNIHTQQWDDELLQYFRIPKALLPEVLDCTANFGMVDAKLLGNEIAITGIAGDQQAATIGQACLHPGMVKSTYGTGCFLMLNTGPIAVVSKQRMITTVAYRIHGKVTYALEGSIFIAGAAIQWLRDALHLFKNSKDTALIASKVENTGGVYFVPAFTGLGAPYWDPLARGAILGITRATQLEQIVRAALESVCYQTRDLLTAMFADYQKTLAVLRVDGGMAANDWMLQFLADILRAPVERPNMIEASICGAAWLAGLGKGIYSSLDELSQLWKLQKTFNPSGESESIEQKYRGWLEAVERVRTNTN